MQPLKNIKAKEPIFVFKIEFEDSEDFIKIYEDDDPEDVVHEINLRRNLT